MTIGASNPLSFLSLGLAAALAGCGPTGGVQFFVQAEDSIPNGLVPGDELENVRDGWAVTYDRFLITLGNFRAAQSARSDARLEDHRLFVIDMLQLPPGGLVLVDFDGVEATRWDRVGFDLGRADGDSVRAEVTSPAGHEAMVAEGLTLLVAGHIDQAGGTQCLPSDASDCVPRERVQFTWALSAATAFDACANDTGVAGFAVPSGGSVPVKPTIHGDHWFFTNITQGTELTERKAQWIADADLDRNGETTLAELEAIPAARLLTAEKGYNLSGSLLPAIATVRDYLEAQVRTLGDYQGDGECPERTPLG